MNFVLINNYMTNKRWKIREVYDDYSVKSLADSLNISDVLSSLLIQRDITNFSQAKNFFRPSLDSLHDPFLMNGMETATYRVITALTENQLIMVYGVMMSMVHALLPFYISFLKN